MFAQETMSVNFELPVRWHYHVAFIDAFNRLSGRASYEFCQNFSLAAADFVGAW